MPASRHSSGMSRYSEFAVKHKLAWEKALEVDTVFEFLAFIDSFPNSKHLGEARRRILILDDDREWSKAKRINSIKSHQSYLEKFPNGTYSVEAKSFIGAAEGKNRSGARYKMPLLRVREVILILSSQPPP